MKWIQESFLMAGIAAAVLIPVMAGIAAVRRRRALKILLGSRSGAEAVHLSTFRRTLKWGAVLLAVLALLGAAARPYWDYELLPVPARGRDVVILFDVSRSMNAADPAPSRLAHAKLLLQQLVEGAPGDRFAIVAFAGSAYTLCPLTADHSALLEYIGELSPALAPYGGTNLEAAFREMEKAFFAAEGTRRTVILLTDGEELTGSSARFLERLKNKQIPLIVAGLGDATVGAPVPDENGVLLRDGSGMVVTSRLNETLLRRLAAESGGLYLHSTATHTGLAEIRARLAAAAPGETAEGAARTRPIERFPILIGLAAALLLIALFLPEYAKRGKRPGLLLILGLPLWLGAAPPAEKNGGTQPAAAPPREPYLRYNLARKMQSERQLKEASELYESVIAEAEKQPQLRSRSYYNLGVGGQQEAQAHLLAARKSLQLQQPDQALSGLTAARQAQDLAEVLYGRALASGAAPGKDVSAALLQLAADRRETEKLEKEVKKLQQLQQEAQEKARQAQQQNRQNQQKQQQSSNGRQNRSSAAQKAAEQARQSAENLQRQASKLNQKQQADAARSAVEELKKAAAEQAKKRPQEAQKHLDEAVKKLGAASSPSGEKKREPEPQPEPDRKSPEKTAQAGRGEKTGEASERERSVEARLNSLNSEAGELREKLRREHRQPKVEKDW